MEDSSEYYSTGLYPERVRAELPQTSRMSHYTTDRIYDPMRSPLARAPSGWADNGYDVEEDDTETEDSDSVEIEEHYDDDDNDDLEKSFPYNYQTTVRQGMLPLWAAAVIMTISAGLLLWLGAPTVLEVARYSLGLLSLSPGTWNSTSLWSSSSSSSSLVSLSPGLARDLAPFWRDYRYVLTAHEDFEGWFDDVDDATDIITDMWESVGKPVDHEEAAHRYTKEDIEVRESNIETARARWDSFLARRELLIRDLVGSGGLWRVYAKGKLVSGEQAAKMGTTWMTFGRRLESTDPAVIASTSSLTPSLSSSLSSSMSASPSQGATGDSLLSEDDQDVKPQAVDNHTFTALTLSAQRISEELVDAHMRLFSYDYKHDLGDLKLMQAVLETAADHENRFAGRLRSRAVNGTTLWTKTPATSLSTLHGRLDGLIKRRDDMWSALDPLRVKFSEERLKREMGEGCIDAVSWVNDAKEVLQSWASVVIDTHEGVLFMLRRKQIKRLLDANDCAVDLREYMQSWANWKSDNCGDTSCHEAITFHSLAKDAWDATCFDPVVYYRTAKRAFASLAKTKPTPKGSKQKDTKVCTPKPMHAVEHEPAPTSTRRPWALVARTEQEWSRAVGGQARQGIWSGVYEKACCEDGKLAELLKYGGPKPDW